MLFCIDVPMTSKARYFIEALNEAEAKEVLLNGDFNSPSDDYDFEPDLDTNNWKITLVTR